MSPRERVNMKRTAGVRPAGGFRVISAWRRSSITVLLLLTAAGCSQSAPDQQERMSQGYIYYFDGAGGGGLMNWSGGVRQGMRDAGYKGTGEVFKWNTGLGIVADQESSVEYKKSKAAEAARGIQQYAKEHPGAPVTLIGLSAGTSVTVFTLEALPANCPVDSVVLLGASISSDYDLTRALSRVRNRMYVFTSQQDAVLAFAVTVAGTADRKLGSLAAGLRGFRMPASASPETRAQYAKVVNIAWKPEFIAAGNLGGHTDAVKAPFVQQYIAPLIMTRQANRAPQPILSAMEMVRNPDYDRWTAFSPGAWVTLDGYQVIDGAKQPLRIQARLVSKHQDRLIVERTYMVGGNGGRQADRVQQFVIEAQIKAAEHPLTSPTAKIAQAPAETMKLNGKVLAARVRTVQANGDFPEYGRNVWANVAQNDSVPGGLLKVWLKSSKEGQPYEMRGQIVSYGTQKQ